MSEIPHSRPWIDESDIAAVSRVLHKRMLAQGRVVGELERRLAAWIGMSDGVAVSSGSAAIELALRTVGVAGGDVVMPTYVCRSVMEAVITAGARPVLCDVDEEWVMEPVNVTRVITKQTRCIIVPHMYGVFADVGAFREFGVPIIEDSAQAVAAEGDHRSQADVVVFSLHPTKCLTAGEGGCAVSNPDFVSRMRKLRDGASDGRHSRLFAPLADVGAALALSQLDRYAAFLRRRKEIADRYDAVLSYPRPRIGKQSMNFRYVMHVPGGCDTVKAAFQADGVAVRKGVDELLHRIAGIGDSGFPVAVRHFGSSLSLPIYPGLSDTELDTCLKTAAAVLRPQRSVGRG